MRVPFVPWLIFLCEFAAQTVPGLSQTDFSKELLVVIDIGKGRIQLIDPEIPTALRSYATRPLMGATVNSIGLVYYVDFDNTLKKLNLETGGQTVLASISQVPERLFAATPALAVSPDGRRLVVTHHGTTGPGNVADVGTFYLSVF